MKECLSFIFIVMCFCGNAQLKNPDFEGSGGWFPGYNSKKNVHIDTIEKFAGKKSLLIKNAEKKLTYGVQTFNYPCNSFEKIKVSFQVKGLIDTTSAVNVWVNTYYKRNRLYSIPTVYHDPIPQWKEEQLTLILPPETDGIQIGMSLNGKGNVWFDEFKLEKEPIERQDTSYSESTEKYISEVVKVIKKHALNKDSLDYNNDVENALKLSNFADDSIYLSVTYLLRKLKDGHSFFSEVSTIQNDRKYDKPIDAHHLPSGKILQATLAYVQLPTLAVAGDSLYQVYANTLYNKIVELDQHSPKHWVIDLRNNRGGVVWPMIAGLGPLLKEGVQGYFVYNNNKKKHWMYKKGKAYADKDSQWKLNVKNPYSVKRAETKLLILTDGRTASAAEMIAVMLRGYNNVRIVGKETRGLTSGNASFTLSDGSVLGLTTSRYMDKNGKIYTGKILPDKEVELELNNEVPEFPFNSLFKTIFDTSSTSFMQ